MTDSAWRDLLESALAANRGTHWLSWLHVGIMRYRGGDSNGARQAWLESLECEPSAWAYRNLAVLAQDAGEIEKAARFWAIAARMKPDLQPLAVEACDALLAAGAFAAVRELIEQFPPESASSGRVRLLGAIAALRSGDLAAPGEFFAARCEIPNIREGELSLSDLWFEWQEARLANREGVPLDAASRQQVRREHPLPQRIRLSHETRLKAVEHARQSCGISARLRRSRPDGTTAAPITKLLLSGRENFGRASQSGSGLADFAVRLLVFKHRVQAGGIDGAFAVPPGQAMHRFNRARGLGNRIDAAERIETRHVHRDLGHVIRRAPIMADTDRKDIAIVANQPADGAVGIPNSMSKMVAQVFVGARSDRCHRMAWMQASAGVGTAPDRLGNGAVGRRRGQRIEHAGMKMVEARGEQRAVGTKSGKLARRRRSPVRRGPARSISSSCVPSSSSPAECRWPRNRRPVARP